MNYFKYRQKIPADFDDDSRVWIYQSNRQFNSKEALELSDALHRFIPQWKAHGMNVKGFGELFFDRWIMLMADEKQTGVSGCSTDSMFRLIKDIEQRFHAHLLDRQSLAFIINESVTVIPLDQLKQNLENGRLKQESLYFNNTVQTKKEFQDQWLIPLKESWIARKFAVSLGTS